MEGRRVVGHATAAIIIAEFHSMNLNAESRFDLKEKRQMEDGRPHTVTHTPQSHTSDILGGTFYQELGQIRQCSCNNG